MKAFSIIQALGALSFQAYYSTAAVVTTSVAPNALRVGGCAGVAPENQLQCYKDQCYEPTGGLIGSSCASYPPPNQLACYKSKCPNLGASATITTQLLSQQSPTPLIGGCPGVAPQYQLQCYKDNCAEPAGPPGSSCASYPPADQLACYKSKCDPKSPTTTIEATLQSPVDLPSLGVGKDCGGVAPEYELECFQKLCPMPGPPGFSCGSLPPQYQLDCYKKRCHEVYTSTAPAPAQQTSNLTQQTSQLDKGCIGVAPENQLECYRKNCPMPGPIGHSCGSLAPQYQLQCYKTYCENDYTSNAEISNIEPSILPWQCVGLSPQNRELCFERECVRLLCANLPPQDQPQCFKENCSPEYITTLLDGLGGTLGESLNG